ncbi:hypothetical protein QX995_002160 [Vibrio vulnificus]|nr:hypothetical protein [Vibrio vulnificus]
MNQESEQVRKLKDEINKLKKENSVLLSIMNNNVISLPDSLMNMEDSTENSSSV